VGGSAWEGVSPGVGEGAVGGCGGEIDGLEGASDRRVAWCWGDTEQPNGIRGGKGGVEILVRRASANRLLHADADADAC
jgi:hypothetical protein